MPLRRSRSSVKTEVDDAEAVEAESRDTVRNGAHNGEKKADQSQWVVITPDGVLECDPNNENKPVFVRLQHPKTEEAGLFMFTHGDTSVYEVNKFCEKFRSWLIDDTVQADGSLFMVTPMDPVYLVLPYLITTAQTGTFMTLDQTVVDSNYPECHRLVSCSGDLSCVADVKGDDDLKVYRYNKEKTLAWLKLKVERVTERLQQRGVHIGSSGQSATYVRSLKAEVLSTDDYRRYACGMVSDYLPCDVGNSLADYLDMPVKEEHSTVVEPPSKKVKMEASELVPTEDYSKAGKKVDKSQKNGAMTVGQKKLLNADKTGMKNISSFFSPKSKS